MRHHETSRTWNRTLGLAAFLGASLGAGAQAQFAGHAGGGYTHGSGVPARTAYPYWEQEERRPPSSAFRRFMNDPSNQLSPASWGIDLMDRKAPPADYTHNPIRGALSWTGMVDSNWDTMMNQRKVDAEAAQAVARAAQRHESREADGQFAAANNMSAGLASEVRSQGWDNVDANTLDKIGQARVFADLRAGERAGIQSLYDGAVPDPRAAWTPSGQGAFRTDGDQYRFHNPQLSTDQLQRYGNYSDGQLYSLAQVQSGAQQAGQYMGGLDAVQAPGWSPLHKGSNVSVLDQYANAANLPALSANDYYPLSQNRAFQTPESQMLNTDFTTNIPGAYSNQGRSYDQQISNLDSAGFFPQGNAPYTPGPATSPAMGFDSPAHVAAPNASGPTGGAGTAGDMISGYGAGE